MSVPLPQMPCDACLHDPACCTSSEHVTAVYCEHRQVGLHYGNGLYTLYTPVTRSEYLALVAALEVRLEARAPSTAAN